MPRIERISRSDGWRREFIRKHEARCHYCNRKGTMDMGPDDRPWWVDHMHALARGGPDTEDNLVLACKRCNLCKSVKPYKQFVAFARAAFWVPDDWRVPEFDLDDLMSRHQQIHEALASVADDPSWRVDDEQGRIVVTGTEGYDGNFVEPILKLDGMAAGWRSYDFEKQQAFHLLTLTADMYRLLPALIAEIRVLRSEAEVEEDKDRPSVLTAL